MSEDSATETTIKISRDARDELKREKRYGSESYDAVLRRLIRRSREQDAAIDLANTTRVTYER